MTSAEMASRFWYSAPSSVSDGTCDTCNLLVVRCIAAGWRPEAPLQNPLADDVVSFSTMLIHGICQDLGIPLLASCFSKQVSVCRRSGLLSMRLHEVGWVGRFYSSWH